MNTKSKIINTSAITYSRFHGLSERVEWTSMRDPLVDDQSVISSIKTKPRWVWSWCRQAYSDVTILGNEDGALCEMRWIVTSRFVVYNKKYLVELIWLHISLKCAYLWSFVYRTSELNILKLEYSNDE